MQLALEQGTSRLRIKFVGFGASNLLDFRQRAVDAKHLGHMLGTC
jgi:hypothetical protein